MTTLPIRPRRGGFTLVELLVVVFILAILVLVATRSTEGLLDQSRYEATQRGLQEIEDAILGPVNPPADGTIAGQGFVQDMGRLPYIKARVVPKSDGTTETVYEPAELFAQSGAAVPGVQAAWSLPPYQPFAHTPVTIGPDTFGAEMHAWFGWRGAYLRLGAGELKLHDGWGNGYYLVDAAGKTTELNSSGAFVNGPPATDMAPTLIGSLGSDGRKDVTIATDYTGDLYTARSVAAASVTATVDVYVYKLDPVSRAKLDPSADEINSALQTLFLGSNGAGASTELPPPTAIMTGTYTASAPYYFSSQNFSFTAPIGPVVLRAHQSFSRKISDGMGGTVVKTYGTGVTDGPGRYSAIANVVLRPGYQKIELILTDPPGLPAAVP